MENKDFDVVKEDMFDTIEEVIDITASEINIESKTVNEKIIEEDLEEAFKMINAAEESVTEPMLEPVTEAMLESAEKDIQEQAADPVMETVNLPDEKRMDPYFVKRPGGAVLGGFMEFFGFSFSVITGILLVGVIALDIVFQGVSFLLGIMIILAMIIALCLFVGVKGRIIRGRAKRFKLYKRILNGREICDIEELAEEAEKTEEFVVKDLTDMIDRKWFLQGHLDSAQKHLIVTDTMYEQYTLVMGMHH